MWSLFPHCSLVKEGEDDQDNLFVLESSPITGVRSTLPSPCIDVGPLLNPVWVWVHTQVGTGFLPDKPLACLRLSRDMPMTK